MLRLEGVFEEADSNIMKLKSRQNFVVLPMTQWPFSKWNDGLLTGNYCQLAGSLVILN